MTHCNVCMSAAAIRSPTAILCEAFKLLPALLFAGFVAVVDAGDAAGLVDAVGAPRSEDFLKSPTAAGVSRAWCGMTTGLWATIFSGFHHACFSSCFFNRILRSAEC